MGTRTKVLILYNRPDRGFDQMGCSESDMDVWEQVETVAAAMEKLKMPHGISSVGSTKEVIRVLSRAPERIVFNLIEALEGSAVKACYVPLLCEAFDKAYTGCDTRCLLISTDKWQSKAVLSAAGLPCPSAIVVKPKQKARPHFAGPYIVKPVAADASEGIDNASIVRTRGAALEKAVKRIHCQFKQAAIVEQFIDGREFSITILHKNGKPMVMPLAEFDFSAFGPDLHRIIGYDAKWRKHSFEFQNTPRIIPAQVSKSLAGQLTDLTMRAAAAVGCTNYCRVDFRVDRKNRPYILEVNANPDLSPQDGVAAAVRTAGIAYHQFIRLCLDNAVARTKRAVN